MICLLKNGKRVFYDGNKSPEDKKLRIKGSLLCEWKSDLNFEYWFVWEDVIQAF